MECNKDEAVRAKEIAEKKFIGRDYTGAKKFALKAQSLYPDLEGLSQMLSVFNVYISAENRIKSGEVDWYCVLDVNCCADDKTVKKQYHKLALMLHPDKNKSLGADGAFKLVQEAWVLLSDKEKRLAYNQKLNPMGRQQKESTQTKVPSAQNSANGFHNHNSAATSNKKTQNKNMRSRPTSAPSSSSRKPDTFCTTQTKASSAQNSANGFHNHNSAATSDRKTQNKNMRSKPNSASPSSQKPDKTKASSAQNSANGFHNHNSTGTSNTKTQNKNMQSRPTSAPSSSSKKPGTFWTVCNKCMMRYLYWRIYLSHYLLCPTCRQPFLAVEKDPPSDDKKSSKNSRNHAANSNPFNSHRNGGQSSGSGGFGALSSTNGPGKAASTSTAGRGKSVVQNPHGQVKRADDQLRRADDQLRRAQDQVKRELEEASDWGKHASKRTDGLACGVDKHFKRRRC